MARKIMIQGTMSDVGKSIIAAGLCRIFYQDGYRVAPFKSQNMALNSFVTKDGLEMGRAQALQAFASGRDPQIEMNPVLLKPNDNMASQVIVMGEVLRDMGAVEYFREKKKLVPRIMEAFDKLEKDNDIIVLEGAGSPAEININSDDIVNFGMARLASSPVILVGDIDRGGVFAQLAGTMLLLKDWEKSYVKGTIINKFRGDRSILESGLEMLEELTGQPVLGVVPFTSIALEAEDSLDIRPASRPLAPIDIAVIRLPRISNFTDFKPLELSGYVNLRYVLRSDEIGKPDMLILPGTKNTIGDLLWLRERGFDKSIREYARSGGVVFGICGGFQMLGEKLTYEGDSAGAVPGLALLPVKTVFGEEKIRRQVKGRFKDMKGVLKSLENTEFEGYEIHMGLSFSGISDDGPEKSDGSVSGAEDQKGGAVISRGNIYGTYVHGIFDRGGVLDGIAEALIRNGNHGGKDIKNPFSEGEIKGSSDYSEIRERELDSLADVLRESLNMKRIYGILGNE